MAAGRPPRRPRVLRRRRAAGRRERVRLPGSPFRSDVGRGERGPAPVLGADDHLLDRAGRRGTPMARRGDRSRRRPPPAARRRPRRRLHVGDRRVVGHAAARRPRRRRDQARVRAPARPDPPHRSAADRRGLARHQRRVPGLRAGKRAVTLNVDTPEGQELARRLIATADVVTANYTPDRLDRWGFDRETLAALRPGLIVANLAVMGLSGPDAGWRSYGNGLVAMSGIAAHTGFEGRVPQCLGTMHTDFTVPYFGAMQILAALHHRDRTGEGAYLELSQYESSVRLLDVELAARAQRRRRPRAATPTGRRGARRTGSTRRPRTTGGWRSPVATTASGRGSPPRSAPRRRTRRSPRGPAARTASRDRRRAARRRRAGQRGRGSRRSPRRPDDARGCGRMLRAAVRRHRRGPAGTDHVGRRTPAAAPCADVDGAHLRRASSTSSACRPERFAELLDQHVLW